MKLEPFLDVTDSIPDHFIKYFDAATAQKFMYPEASIEQLSETIAQAMGDWTNMSATKAANKIKELAMGKIEDKKLKDMKSH